MSQPHRSEKPVAVLAGMGAGLGLALVRSLLAAGYRVAGLSRNATPRLELGRDYLALAADVTQADSLSAAIDRIEWEWGPVSVYIHNAATLLRRDFLQTAPDEFCAQWQRVCLGAVHGAQRVLPAMLKQGRGTLLFSGATASVKAGAQFSAFAAAKFALRGLAQALAREYAAAGIHVAHVILDGAIWGPQAQGFGRHAADCLAPAAIAQSYLQLIQQPPTAWSFELDLRNQNEVF